MLGTGLTMAFLEMEEDSSHLAAFHAGERAAIERCYRDHYAAVAAAARRILRPVDAETVTHEVFHRLVASAEMRATFRGGDLGAWLARVTTNRAIDHKRRYAREEPLSPTLPIAAPQSDESDRLSARLVVERFRRERLPPKWERVFDARFLKQLGQREAALALGMSRTTLMYQEHRIRALLRRFVLEDDA
jgi:RNA polymerase sigma-70 factor (ECF subfamily)